MKLQRSAFNRNSEKRKQMQLKQKEHSTKSEDIETRNPRNNDLLPRNRAPNVPSGNDQRREQRGMEQKTRGKAQISRRERENVKIKKASENNALQMRIYID